MIRPHCHVTGNGDRPEPYPGGRFESRMGMGTDPLHDVLRAKGPGLTRHFASSAKQHHGRDTLNAEAGPKRLLRLCVHLGQANVWFKNPGSLLIGRRHRTAGPAPRRPEIHDQRKVAPVGVQVEVRQRQRNRVSGEQPLVTLAAFRAIREACCRNAIDGAACAHRNASGAAGSGLPTQELHILN